MLDEDRRNLDAEDNYKHSHFKTLFLSFEFHMEYNSGYINILVMMGNQETWLEVKQWHYMKQNYRKYLHKQLFI